MMSADRAPRLLQSAWLIGTLIFVVLAATHRSPLFLQPWHEHSDYAVDALQIDLAAEGRAIHGSYSRFGFHQPGPAFFYVCALSEQLFHRWLGIVPSPYNACVLGALIVQCFFFTAGVVIAASWIRRPLFLPLALFALALHLSLAGNAFGSTWQPRLVLMPFFAFIVGAASVAAGRFRHLPLTVLAGCFLVHSHVAQPLYVIPVFCSAYLFAWWQVRRGPQPSTPFVREHAGVHILSVACIALFIVPFIVDLSYGAEGNLARILEFECSYHGAHKPLWKSLLFFAGFFGYVKKPEEFLTAVGADRSAAIGERLGGYFVWFAIVVAVLIFLFRVRAQRGQPERPFILALGALTILTVLLSFYWGRAQVGRIYEYNGYFYYAILCCILVIFCAALSRASLLHSRWLGAVLCAGAVWLTWQTRTIPPPIDYSNTLIPVAVDRALKADPLPNATKYLLFNREDWGEAISIGLALKRSGHAFLADADWGPKFAPGIAFEPTPPQFEMDGISVWRLSRFGPRDQGALIRDNLRTYFTPLPLDPRDATIDCAENGNLELYTLFGFASPLHGAAWTIRPYAALICDSSPVSSDILVTIVATPYSVPGETPAQPMSLQVNGHRVFEYVLTAHGEITARVPREVWNASTPKRIVFQFPRAISPRERGLALDERKFGWNIEKMTFQLATDPPAAVE